MVRDDLAMMEEVEIEERNRREEDAAARARSGRRPSLFDQPLDRGPTPHETP